jgi:DNA repair exonuclease SbcCD ATPase subunit
VKIKLPKVGKGEKQKKKKIHEHGGEQGPCPFCRREYLILNSEVDEDMQKLNNGEWTQTEYLKKKLEMIAQAEKLLADMKVKYEDELAAVEKKQ